MRGVPRGHMSRRINRAWFRRKYGSPQTATSITVNPHIQPASVQATRFLRAEPQPCTCDTQSCTVEDALSFMNCIDSSCSNPKCGCVAGEFFDACDRLKGLCSNLHLSCSADRVAVATTQDALNETLASLDRAPESGDLSVTPYGHSPQVHGDGKYFYHHAGDPAPAPAPAPAPVPAPQSAREGRVESEEKNFFSVEETQSFYYHRLKQLKLEKCRHEVAHNSGWVNARARLQEVLVKIDEDMTELRKRSIALPEMHCEKDFEEFHLKMETHSGTDRRGLWMGSLLIAAAFA